MKTLKTVIGIKEMIMSFINPILHLAEIRYQRIQKYENFHIWGSKKLL
jgi:hypothetical protein